MTSSHLLPKAYNLTPSPIKFCQAQSNMRILFSHHITIQENLCFVSLKQFPCLWMEHVCLQPPTPLGILYRIIQSNCPGAGFAVFTLKQETILYLYWNPVGLRGITYDRCNTMFKFLMLSITLYFQFTYSSKGTKYCVL